MTDFTSLQVYSPQHAFIRFGLPHEQRTLTPQEWLAWQMIQALNSAENAYYIANGSYTAFISLLDLPSWFPLVLDGYTLSLQTSVGSGEYLDDPTASYSRVNASISPVCCDLRGFGLNRVFITSGVYGEFQTTFYGMNLTPGAAVDATTFDPFAVAPDGYDGQATLQGAYVDAHPQLTDCFDPARPHITLQGCDRIQLPLYIWKNPSGTLPALSFHLQNMDTMATTLLSSAQPHTVVGATSIRRTLAYTPGAVNSQYRVYSIHIPCEQSPGCYRLLAAAGDIEDPATIVFPSYEFRIGKECKSTLIRYRSRESQSDFIYRSATNTELANAWHQVRLPFILTNYASTHERTTYLRSDGVSIKLQERIGKTYTLATDFLPEPLHEALAIALAHDYVECFDPISRSWQPFILTGEYAIDWPDNLHPLATATAELTHAIYDTVNGYV